LLLVQHRETRRMFCQGPKQQHIEHLEDVSGVRDKGSGSNPRSAEKLANIVGHVT
jgi:hypothetical protein